MAKKTQIAVGARGGRIAGYAMQDGKLKPIYVGTDSAEPTGTSKVPKKKALDTEKKPEFKVPASTEELEADLKGRLHGTGISPSRDFRSGSDGSPQKILRFTGPGGSISGYLSKFNSLVLFPPDREYLSLGSASDKNLDAATRFIKKYCQSSLDYDKDTSSTLSRMGDRVESASRILGSFKAQRSEKDRRKKSLAEKVPKDALEAARAHFKSGGDRKSLLPKMVEFFGGNQKKARRFIRKVHETVVPKSELKKGMSGSPDGWATHILSL